MKKKLVIVIMLVAAAFSAAVAVSAFCDGNPGPLSVAEYADSVPYEEKIDINTADSGKLKSLPGIGDVLAERIIEFRTQIGGFTSTQQLMEVEGIGESLYNAIKFMVKV